MNMLNYLEEEETLDGEPQPVGTIAGEQTPRELVAQRIQQVRQPPGEPGSASIDFAKDSAMTAGIGRGLNALAAGTGFKADNSGYDAMDRQGAELIGKDADRSAQVKMAIERRKMAEANGAFRDKQLSESKRHHMAMESVAGHRFGKNRDLDALPAEDAEVVKDLAKKNASKIAISNQIEAVMNNWDSLPDDQKVAQGRQLLKVLNSTEGADAVGTEEAKRLGGKLEFALGNFTNSNPTQFGRDLPGFKEQASGTAKAIKSAIRANQLHQNQLYRNHGIARTDPPEIEPAKYAGKPQDGLVNDAMAGSGRVTVTNGKETYSIELDDLPDALGDGFQVKK